MSTNGPRRSARIAHSQQARIIAASSDEPAPTDNAEETRLISHDTHRSQDDDKEEEHNVPEAGDGSSVQVKQTTDLAQAPAPRDNVGNAGKREAGQSMFSQLVAQLLSNGSSIELPAGHGPRVKADIDSSTRPDSTVASTQPVVANDETDSLAHALRPTDKNASKRSPAKFLTTSGMQFPASNTLVRAAQFVAIDLVAHTSSKTRGMKFIEEVMRSVVQDDNQCKRLHRITGLLSGSTAPLDELAPLSALGVAELHSTAEVLLHAIGFQTGISLVVDSKILSGVLVDTINDRSAQNGSHAELKEQEVIETTNTLQTVEDHLIDRDDEIDGLVDDASSVLDISDFDPDELSDDYDPTFLPERQDLLTPLNITVVNPVAALSTICREVCRYRVRDMLTYTKQCRRDPTMVGFLESFPGSHVQQLYRDRLITQLKPAFAHLDGTMKPQAFRFLLYLTAAQIILPIVIARLKLSQVPNGGWTAAMLAVAISPTWSSFVVGHYKSTLKALPTDAYLLDKDEFAQHRAQEVLVHLQETNVIISAPRLRAVRYRWTLQDWKGAYATYNSRSTNSMRSWMREVQFLIYNAFSNGRRTPEAIWLSLAGRAAHRDILKGMLDSISDYLDREPVHFMKRHFEPEHYIRAGKVFLDVCTDDVFNRETWNPMTVGIALCHHCQPEVTDSYLHEGEEYHE